MKKGSNMIGVYLDDYIEIGPVPAEEPCPQLGEPDYTSIAYNSCMRFIELIRKHLGVEPVGAKLEVRPNRHDFGIYYEVAVRFDSCNDEAVAYAYNVERNAPVKWDKYPDSNWR